MQPVWIVGVGLVAGLALDRTASWNGKLATGAACAAVIAVSIAWHQLGTFAVGRLVGAPFKAVVLTATLAYQIYEEPAQPSNVHLLRALAGPASISSSACSRCWRSLLGRIVPSSGLLRR